MGILFVIATPIGNLQDITIRGIKTLFEVDTLICEDTRKAGLLLQNLEPTYHDLIHNGHHAIKKPKFLSYFEQNELRRIPEIVSLLESGQHMALISDAGTPLVSDPGYKLVREVIRHSIPVETIPGASAVITALVASGLPTDKFTFLGYPPHKSGHRIKMYENIKKSQEIIKTTTILYEAPHKLIKTLEELHTVFGDIDITVARELTKLHEEIRREKISMSLEHFKKTPPRGEIVLLF